MTNPSKPALHAPLTSTVILSALCALAPARALAHHPTGGQTPSTLAAGLMSGLAHPVIGLDHLFFVLLVGAYAGIRKQPTLPVAFVASTVVGCLLHTAGFDLALSEKCLAGTLILVGLAVCTALRLSELMTLLVVAACGVLHGYAYGESIVGAEPAPLLTYLLAFAAVQLVLASAMSLVARKLALSEHSTNAARLVRTLGVATALSGVFLIMQ